MLDIKPLTAIKIKWQDFKLSTSIQNNTIESGVLELTHTNSYTSRIQMNWM